MDDVTRRAMLAASAAGGFLTAANAAVAQSGPVPQPQRPGRGGTDPGPRNLMRDRQNPDLLVPPSIDQGTLPNLRFSFSDAHARPESGGWARQVTVHELGVSKNIAGVDMRLNAGGVRELHWHKAAEWAYMLYGTARITAIDAQGRYFVDDVGIGDLWYFAESRIVRRCSPSTTSPPSTGSICERPTSSKARSRPSATAGCAPRDVSNKTALAMIFKLAEAAERSWRRLDGLTVAEAHPRCKVRRRNRGRQIASSSCRLTPSVTKIRR
jgi:Cupin